MRKAIQVFAVLLFLTGFGLFCWPYVYHSLYGNRLSKEITQFTQVISPPQDAAVPTEEAPAPAYPELVKAMGEYNRQLVQSNQAGLTEKGGFEISDFSLREYGVDSDILGFLRIPALDRELPIYMGASDENLALGAAWYARTSLPVGGEDTNTVIAAHTRYNGFEMFRYLSDLKIGDDIFLTSFAGTLHYRVCGTAVIDPEEISRIVIQPGRELVTLTTCYPFPENYQRYLVYAERCE